MKIMKIIIINNLKDILMINSKIYIDLGLKEKENQINKLDRLWIIIINKTVSFFVINQSFFKLNVTFITDIYCK